MSLRRKIFLAFVSLMLVFSISITYWSVQEGRNVYAYAIEEILVDVSKLFSEQIQLEIESKKITLKEINWYQAIDSLKKSSFQIRILSFEKQKSALDAYITDDKGIVVFSSRDPSEIGKDYSGWKDVALTLKGEYGSRSTRLNKDDKETSSYYIAAPIKINNNIIGVVTVIKPRTSVTAILNQYLYKILIGVALGMILAIAFGLLLFLWITKPIEKLKEYAASVTDNKRAKLPYIPHADIRKLAESFENMRITLEGQKTIEKFIQTLIHELKSPLSAIRGSSELLLEPMVDDQKKRFINNILTESSRSETILEKILKVAELESHKYNIKKIKFELVELVDEIEKSFSPILFKQKVSLVKHFSESKINCFGDEFLIGQAIRNVIQNAIDFSFEGGQIFVRIDVLESDLQIVIEDNGAGIPLYAENRIFEKFYSLERPMTGKKGTGLGLNFVREVVDLHEGRIEIKNKSDGPGVLVSINLPVVD